MFWYKKSSLKSFEESTYNNCRRNINNDKRIYVSPDSGLLIYDKTISSDKFEFYIYNLKKLLKLPQHASKLKKGIWIVLKFYLN